MTPSIIPANRLPKPSLPRLNVHLFHGWKAVRVLSWRACLLFIGAVMVKQVWTLKSDNMLVAVMPLMVPVCYILAVCPYFFRKAPAA